MIITTEGLVLKRYDFRETSFIVVMLARDWGKVRAVMKGIRRDPRKFGSNVDLFSLNDFVYYQYRRSDLHLISKCDMKGYFFHIRQDYQRSLVANQILDIVNQFLPPEEPNNAVYNLTLVALTALDEGRDPDTTLIVFQLKLLQLSGFRPYLDACIRCGQPVGQYIWVSYQSGGLICTHCPAYESDLVAITRGTLASFTHILTKPWNEAIRLSLAGSVRKEN